MTTLLASGENDEAEVQRRPSRWARLGAAAPAYVPALMVAVGGWQHRWMDEDAFINFRIVDQIFAGHGPVFNAGERIEASTSALWLLVLVVGRAVFGSFVSMEWIALFAGLFGRWPSRAEWIGLAVGLAGVALLQTGGDMRASPAGALVLTLSCVSWSLGSIGAGRCRRSRR